MAMFNQPYGYPYGGYGMQMQSQPQQVSNGITWVQGEQAARSYLVAAGSSVLLMDSDAQRFYLKSADSSGMPQPLRIFEYTEVQPGQVAMKSPEADQYVTRKEFDELRAMVINEPKEAKSNGKSSV